MATKYDSDIVGWFTKNGKRIPRRKFSSPSTKVFHGAFNNARDKHEPKNKWRVDNSYTVEDYKNMKLYKAYDGSTFAIHDEDIVSVCAIPPNKGGKVTGRELLEEAVKQGGKKLDAFSGIFTFYTKCGFEPVSVCKGVFEGKYKPNGWEKSFGEEDIVFFKYTGNQQDIDFDDWIKTVKYSKGYDEAKKRRDDSL